MTQWRTYVTSICVHSPTHEWDQTKNTRISRFYDFIVVLVWVTGSPLTHMKPCLKSWGLPSKRVWYVLGLLWKLVGHFGSRNYFQSDFLRVWPVTNGVCGKTCALHTRFVTCKGHRRTCLPLRIVCVTHMSCHTHAHVLPHTRFVTGHRRTCLVLSRIHFLPLARHVREVTCVYSKSHESYMCARKTHGSCVCTCQHETHVSRLIIIRYVFWAGQSHVCIFKKSRIVHVRSQ